MDNMYLWSICRLLKSGRFIIIVSSQDPQLADKHFMYFILFFTPTAKWSRKAFLCYFSILITAWNKAWKKFRSSIAAIFKTSHKQVFQSHKFRFSDLQNIISEGAKQFLSRQVISWKWSEFSYFAHKFSGLSAIKMKGTIIMFSFLMRNYL